MCGRYYLDPTEEFEDRFQLTNRLENRGARYNIAPGQSAPVIANNDGNEVEELKWGLVPFWAKDPKIGNKLINARAETIIRKPSFRKAFTTQRCLVPISGFYEWQRVGDSKIPYLFREKQGTLFALAGIYDFWKDAEGHILKTYAIITTKPNKIVAKIHNRMPVILPRRNETDWLNPDTDINILKKLMEPSSEELDYYPVSANLNRSFENSPILIQPKESV